jgi:hypothetical protein
MTIVWDALQMRLVVPVNHPDTLTDRPHLHNLFIFLSPLVVPWLYHSCPTLIFIFSSRKNSHKLHIIL